MKGRFCGRLVAGSPTRKLRLSPQRSEDLSTNFLGLDPEKVLLLMAHLAGSVGLSADYYIS
jgi:hypothetical protein